MACLDIQKLTVSVLRVVKHLGTRLGKTMGGVNNEGPVLGVGAFGVDPKLDRDSFWGRGGGLSEDRRRWRKRWGWGWRVYGIVGENAQRNTGYIIYMTSQARIIGCAPKPDIGNTFTAKAKTKEVQIQTKENIFIAVVSLVGRGEGYFNKEGRGNLTLAKGGREITTREVKSNRLGDTSSSGQKGIGKIEHTEPALSFDWVKVGNHNLQNINLEGEGTGNHFIIKVVSETPPRAKESRPGKDSKGSGDIDNSCSVHPTWVG
ncbi:hypothetical protein C8R42DRAFT_646156 [Lentinula raphanica]|nr:hypothetical protein C8R42DRAFT_646156 [Lentinula raphanica]